MKNGDYAARTRRSFAGSPVLFKTLGSQKKMQAATEPMLFRSFLKTEEPPQLLKTKNPRSIARELLSRTGRSGYGTEISAEPLHRQQQSGLQNNHSIRPDRPVLFEVGGNPRRKMGSPGETEKKKNQQKKALKPAAGFRGPASEMTSLKKKQERQQNQQQHLKYPEQQKGARTENLPEEPTAEQKQQRRQQHPKKQETKPLCPEPRDDETKTELSRNKTKSTQDQEEAKHSRWQKNKIKKSAEFARIRWSTAHHPAFGWLESVPGAQDLLLPNPNVDPDLAFRMFLSKHWAAAFPTQRSASAAKHSLPELGWEGVFRSLTVDGVPLGPPTRRQLTNAANHHHTNPSLPKKNTLEGNIAAGVSLGVLGKIAFTTAIQALFTGLVINKSGLGNTDLLKTFKEKGINITENTKIDEFTEQFVKVVLDEAANSETFLGATKKAFSAANSKKFSGAAKDAFSAANTTFNTETNDTYNHNVSQTEAYNFSNIPDQTLLDNIPINPNSTFFKNIMVSDQSNATVSQKKILPNKIVHY